MSTPNLVNCANLFTLKGVLHDVRSAAALTKASLGKRWVKNDEAAKQHEALLFACDVLAEALQDEEELVLKKAKPRR
jgi:hypothetical protein